MNDRMYRRLNNSASIRVDDYIDAFVVDNDDNDDNDSGVNGDDAVNAINAPAGVLYTDSDSITDDAGNRSTPIYSISPDFIAQW